MICYLDDDLDSDRLIGLGAAYSHQFLSPRSLGSMGMHDALHFLRATREGAPILTKNVSDFEALHEFAIGIGGTHAGVIVVHEEADHRKNMRPEHIVRALARLEAANITLSNHVIALKDYR